MENLIVGKNHITWERVHKNKKEVKYKSRILNHGNHISVSKEMYVNGEFKHIDLTHIPLELIDKIKELESV